MYFICHTFPLEDLTASTIEDVSTFENCPLIDGFFIVYNITHAKEVKRFIFLKRCFSFSSIKNTLSVGLLCLFRANRSGFPEIRSEIDRNEERIRTVRLSVRA